MLSEGSSWKRGLLLALGLALVAIYLFPLYWMYATALKSQSEIFAQPPTLWPREPQLRLAEVWTRMKMDVAIGNSLLIAAGSTALVVLLGTGCAYALARVRNRWMDAALFLVLMMQVLPSSLMITPIFVAYAQIGLTDMPRLGVILAQAAKALPLYIVLCRATFLQVPRELEEAARVDGHSRLGAFLWIMVPLARNGLLVCAILIFMQGLGEYVYARSLIADRAYQPATVGLQSFMGPNSSDWAGVMTYAAIYVTPILILFVLLQRQIVSGLTSGALK
ncbi:carbohydrate ABC transporter membrane protein 2, CUT1 family [Rubellimicrobium thermophilum DSM 16684]|uniref:Carbohydrate ABC transporter membrane protein 2, CUT1 family n=1 Tax=Rubellimicrobium thermophilum DSM 16684 TaxID=1123069 RepID=S9R765_9RHOB|nr:carbohydrate ABC transporter permease [Rubellimicrobium thermophilum]EPX87727.1 carbohydrate ABC transporter membrane protein 2, CUT1 family [Rubellimicrobium thermophilum DSM 16684]